MLKLKLELFDREIRQNRMAADLGWDATKLSKILNEFVIAKPAERAAILRYLQSDDESLFQKFEQENK